MSAAPAIADVSVVIPVFNSGADALVAIRSVQAQTLQPREIVVVDDGSTDGSAAIIAAAVAGSTPPVRIVSTPNAGAAGARNTGIAHASASHLAFLDSDDRWLPDKLARVHYKIRRYNSAQEHSQETQFPITPWHSLT